jgi:hypothetical protein
MGAIGPTTNKNNVTISQVLLNIGLRTAQRVCLRGRGDVSSRFFRLFLCGQKVKKPDFLKKPGLFLFMMKF